MTSADDKKLFELQARAALVGRQVRQAYTLSNHVSCMHCTSMAELERRIAELEAAKYHDKK